MKIISIVLFLVLSIPAKAIDNKHLSATAMISSATYIGARENGYSKPKAAIVTFIVTNLIGYAKEMSDPIQDPEDYQSNALGSSIGILLPMSFSF